MTTDAVLAEVKAERAYQDQKWGTTTDDINTPHHWAGYVSQYATRHLIGDPRNPVDLVAFRADMVKVAALAVAAVEALDRKP